MSTNIDKEYENLYQSHKNLLNDFIAKENILNQLNLLPYRILEEVLSKAGLIERKN